MAERSLAAMHGPCHIPRTRDFAFKTRRSFPGNTLDLRRRCQRGPHSRWLRAKVVAEGAIKEGELVSSEEEFLRKVTEHKGAIIVDWMAKWCRKCIYLKPKLEKMLNEDFPGLDLVFIDVNSIPGTLVYGHGIQKMPTITIHKNGEKLREHIAAEAAPKAIANIRTMVKDYMELNPDDKALISGKR